MLFKIIFIKQKKNTSCFMEFLKKYTSHEEYEVDKTPNVSLCVENNEKHLHYTRKKFDNEYLTFEALESGTFTLTIGSGVTTGDVVSVSYSLDNGETWETTNNIDGQQVVITTPTVNAGDEVLWKGNANRMANGASSSSASTFSSTTNFNARGNVTSLLYGDDFKGEVSLSGKDNCFYRLFGSARKLVNGKNISLPATTLAMFCYSYMFFNCTSLTTAPELPSTTLVNSCYEYMFNGCTSLTVAPELPATTLAMYCYEYMFNNCTSLIKAPELPATTLARNCYWKMFNNCTNLTTAPELPAETLANECYRSMFHNCTSLTVAPELPATTLASYCYESMFYNCTSLTVAPELPATTLAEHCYDNMFYGCTSLTAAPELPATTLAQYCYASMFVGCTSLTTAPELPATTLANWCYRYMFAGCTSLTTAPVLPATTLANSCYDYMFANCAILNSIKMLSAYQYYEATYLLDWVINVAAYGKYTMSESVLQNYLQGDKNLRSFIPKGWEVWYVDSNGDEYYVGINDESGSNTYGYDYNYGYNYDYSYGYGYNGNNGYDPLSGNRYPFDFYHDDDNTNTFRITNTGSTTVNSEIYFVESNVDGCIFGDYHHGLVYSYDGYVYSDVPYKKTCPTTITIEPNQTIFLKGIMRPYLHGFKIHIFAPYVEIGGNILSVVDPQNMENSIYDGMYTQTNNIFTFDGFESKYLTVRVLEDNTTITYNTDFPQGNIMYYSTDNGSNWSQLSTSITANTGNVLLKMNGPSFSPTSTGTYPGIGHLGSDKYINICGNIMSLLYGDDFKGEVSLSGKGEAFAALFMNNNKVCDASLLMLPATTLADSCYFYMFEDCTSLTVAPELPATTMEPSCYGGMFNGCTSLTTAPDLPATTLADGCYSNMFQGCTSLTTAPELPATTLAERCYSTMFSGCTSLVSAPELPATTLVQYCYSYMFNGCTSLNYIKAMFTTTPSNTYTENWVKDVASTGTFVKNSAAQWIHTGVDSAPTGWTVQNAN